MSFLDSNTSSQPPIGTVRDLRRSVIRIGWVLYPGFLLLLLFLAASSGETALICFSIMTVSAYAVARAGSGGQRIAGILALLFALLMLVLVQSERIQARSYRKIRRARSTAVSLSLAIKQYWLEFGIAPTGNPLDIMHALRGDNPRKIIFSEAAGSDFNPAGELIDPWGMPYHVDLSNPENPRVYSFGKNKRDESGAVGSDDICSWR